jgi:beta-glucosidase-like glycosyl hydrolase
MILGSSALVLGAAIGVPLGVYTSVNIDSETDPVTKFFHNMGESYDSVGHVLSFMVQDATCFANDAWCPTEPARDVQTKSPSVQSQDPSAAPAPKDTPSPSPASATKTNKIDPIAENCMSRHISLSERLGKLMMIKVDANNTAPMTPLFNSYHIGGAVLTGQIADPSKGEVKEFKAATNALIAVEQGEINQPFSNLSLLPAPAIVAATQTPEQAKTMVAEHARKLHEAGVDVVLGAQFEQMPSSNTAIQSDQHDQDFGKSPEEIRQYNTAYLQGWIDGGILPVAELFGDDTDLQSYNNLGNNFGDNVGALTRQHATTNPNNVQSAQLSTKDITGKLRNQMDFKGLIITELLSNESIQGKLSVAVGRALIDGNDMIYVKDSPADTSWNAQLYANVAKLQKLYESGELTDKRINASIVRIQNTQEIKITYDPLC